jgi:ubiquinone/menaquinone biosynthesis C-methylase UbiE
MGKNEVTALRVKAANRQLYDAVAGCYEEIDGRRSPALESWLRRKLMNLRQRSPGGGLLDIGTGSGLMTRCAAGIFSLRVGLDLSAKILAANRRAFDYGVAADVDALPFADNSFDAVICFAVLHHLYGFEGLVAEVARVLKPGGIFYSDHDLDALFARRFSWPLALYRRLHSASSRYRRANKEITSEIYHLAEWQEGGVDSSGLVHLFERAGFAVEVEFHWFGLAPGLDRLLGAGFKGYGWAPLLSLMATGGKQ